MLVQPVQAVQFNVVVENLCPPRLRRLRRRHRLRRLLEKFVAL